MLDALPLEIRACPQWIVWQWFWNAERHKWDKIPLNARTGFRCDVGQAASWSTYDDACAAVKQHSRVDFVLGLGFVLGYQSGIVGIDFDDVFDAQGNVLNHNHHTTAGQLNSYTERSPSGTGLHVLVKAQWSQGRRFDGVEMYGVGRFFTMTGAVYGGRNSLEARQDQVDELARQIDAARGANSVPLNWTVEATQDDATVHNMASGAANGALYLDLWNGHWTEHYRSQSEADVALVNIIGFYTDSPSQCVRMFLQSGLGQREKAKRTDYTSRLVQKAFDRKPPKVDIPPLPAIIPAPQPVVAPAVVLDTEDAEAEQAMAMDPFSVVAPGAVGYISQWFNAQSNYPMPEINVLGALGVMAAICGRQYQYSGTGLNLYMMLLAKTGAGKEALTDGITRIFSAVITPPPNFGPITTASVHSGFPAAKDFLGNFDLTSGIGIKRSFADSSTLCCAALATEFAQVMTQLADPKVHQGLKDAKQVMLDFYTKSGQGITYQGKLTSDKSKDIKTLQSPTLSIIAQGTPERFYEALNTRMVSDGLLSRFIIIERKGYVPHNPYHADNQVVPEPLRLYVTQLCEHVIRLKSNQDLRLPVRATPDAELYSEQLRAYYRRRLEANQNNEVQSALWNRAHQNVIRIAALVAVGVDFNMPTIQVEHLQWANAIIYRQCLLMIEKFRRGEVGETTNLEGEQTDVAMQILHKWQQLDVQNMGHLNKPNWVQAKMAGVMPYAYLQERSSNYACFRNDKRGPRLALKMLTDALVTTGELELTQLGTFKSKHFKLHL